MSEEEITQLTDLLDRIYSCEQDDKLDAYDSVIQFVDQQILKYY